MYSGSKHTIDPLLGAADVGSQESVVGAQVEFKRLVVDRVTDLASMDDVYRLRYDVYIDEQKKPVPWVDHRNRIYSDSSDRFARRHFVVRTDAGEIIAAVRSHTEPSPTVKDALLWDVFEQAGRGPLYYISKFVVKAEYRRSRAPALLINALTEDYSSIGAEFSLHHCSPRLVPLFERMGFRQYHPEFYDPFSGLQCPMAAPTGTALSETRHGAVLSRAAILPSGHEAKRWFERMLQDGHFDAARRPVGSPESPVLPIQ